MKRHSVPAPALLALSALVAGTDPCAAAAPAAPAQSVNHRVTRPIAASSSPVLPGAGAVHPWREGSVYRLETAPGRVSDIVLQPGETLISVAAGDTARWVVGDTSSGAGPTRRTHILVKPASLGLSTNLVIATDRRVYRLDLATGGRAATSIAWTYPRDELLALERRRAALAAAAPVAGLAIDRLNFNYAIEGDRVSWRPIRAFDDGARVFIEFPPDMPGGEAPPLFVIGSSGKAELVNYRIRGHYYVVDRLFAAAELRLGTKHQKVVKIVRSDGRSRRRGRR